MPEPRREHARILVVDDKQENRQLLWAILVPEGYEVVEAADGAEALEILKDQPIDLVLLDVMMPRIDGIETCRMIRRELKMITLPVIFVTALSDRLSRIRGQAAGGDDFLSKPIDEIELLVRVRNLLRAKAYHDLRDRHQAEMEAELESLRNQLVRVERLATLGTLAGGVGHELNNILTVYNGTLHFLRQRRAQGEPPNDRDISQLERIGEHMSTHARQLLSLARPGPDYAERLDMREVIESTVAMLQGAGRTRRVRVDTELPSEPVPVTVNRTRIEQVLVNLIGNAVDAMQPDVPGHVCVRLAAGDDGRARCQVQDNGTGVPEENLAEIFGTWFTTKPPEKGTGLGLPVVKRIVEQFGGTVTVRSVVGKGSVFTFDLPLADA